MPHRSHEWPETLAQIRLAFADSAFAVHEPVPAPFGDDEVTEIEIRQVYEMSDLPADDARTDEAVAREQRMHDEVAAQAAKRS